MSEAAGSRPRLRRRYRRARRSLDAADQRRHGDAVARHLLNAGLLGSARRLGAYLAADGELDPRPLMARLARRSRILALPVLIGPAPGQRSWGGRMLFWHYRPGDPLQANRFALHEPASAHGYLPLLGIDVLLMPLVAFDDHGNRLGMGGGYYDRALGALPPRLRPRLVGLAHECQRLASPLTPCPWDVKLDAVVPEAGCRRFDGR